MTFIGWVNSLNTSVYAVACDVIVTKQKNDHLFCAVLANASEKSLYDKL